MGTRLTKKHSFKQDGDEFSIQPEWLTDTPLTYNFHVSRVDAVGTVQSIATYRGSWDESPYGHAFIEADILLDEKMKMLERAIRESCARKVKSKTV